MSQDKTEQFLLLRIRAFKDKSAFAVLIQLHGTALMRFLRSKLPRIEDAEDAYSTVCLRLWEYLTSADVKHFSGLAFTIARRTIAQFYKEREMKPTVSIESADGHPLPIPSKESHEHIESNMETRLMLEALETLTPDERDAILMKHIDGYSVKDIAEHIDKTVNATSVLIHRAMKKLKEKYERS